MFRKDKTRFIIDLTLVAPRLKRSTKRNAALPVHLKVLVALEYHATTIF